MNREGYWDYMGRRMREERIKKEVVSENDMWKKEIVEMQKTLQWCFTRIKELNEGKMKYREDREVPEPTGKVSEIPEKWATGTEEE